MEKRDAARQPRQSFFRHRSCAEALKSILKDTHMLTKEIEQTIQQHAHVCCIRDVDLDLQTAIMQ